MNYSCREETNENRTFEDFANEFPHILKPKSDQIRRGAPTLSCNVGRHQTANFCDIELFIQQCTGVVTGQIFDQQNFQSLRPRFQSPLECFPVGALRYKPENGFDFKFDDDEGEVNDIHHE